MAVAPTRPSASRKGGVPNEEKPDFPVREGYHPWSGTRYAVKTDDTWISIARDRRIIEPWGLIDYNFPGVQSLVRVNHERACRQVNWYLREYVGCNQSHDGENWDFTSGLTGGRGEWKGGHIFVPVHRPPRPAPQPAPKAPPLPPPPPVSALFRVRLLGGLSGGKFIDLTKLGKLGKLRKLPKVGAAVDVIFFEIQDLVNKRQAIFVYEGGGIGAGAKWLSATFIGPWNRFRTSKPMEVSEFDGFTRFTTAGGLWWTWNYLTMIGTPAGVDTVKIDMDTGFTWGAGGSTTAGYMHFADYVPFTP